MAVYNDMAAEGKIRIYDVGLEDEARYPEPVKYRRGDIYAPSFDRHEPLAQQANMVLRAVRTDEAPDVDGQSGLAVARVLEAADRALLTGGEVLLADEPVIDITIESIPPISEMPAVGVLDRQATA